MSCTSSLRNGTLTTGAGATSPASSATYRSSRVATTRKSSRFRRSSS